MNVSKPQLLSLFFDFGWVADKDNVGNTLGNNLVGSLKCAIFSTYSKNNALLLGNLFVLKKKKKSHI